MVKVEGETHSVEWSFTGKGNVFYFASNEGKNGVVLDNFGIVAVQGTQHKNIPQSVLEEFAAVRPYDLIIMQYGLNVASPENIPNYKNYAKGMSEVISNFRKAWPNAAILLVSVSDRCKGQQNGKPVTMKGIEELVCQQRDLAKQSKIAFWNMFSAMGGNGSMGRLAAEGNAEKDYTHMNFKGGKLIAKKFGADKELYIGMSPALVIGHPTTLVVSLLLIPVTLLLAVLLPGNQFLPLASLAGMFYVFVMILPYTNGNVLRSFIIGLVVVGLGLYFVTLMAPDFTSAAHSVQQAHPEDASVAVPEGFQAGALDFASSPLSTLIYACMKYLNYIGAAILSVIAIAMLAWNRKRIKG